MACDTMAGAKPLQKEDDPELFNVVDEVRIAAGLPMPRVYLINDGAMNAFATGRDPAHGAVAITAGLRQRLSRDELQGVMAHEVAHIRHYDIRFALLMATMVGLIAFASDAIFRAMWYGGRGVRRNTSDSKGPGGAVGIVLMIVAILLAVLAPVVARIIQMAYSRQREYLADAGAVELTRNPEGLGRWVSGGGRAGCAGPGGTWPGRLTAAPTAPDPPARPRSGPPHGLGRAGSR